MRYTRLPKAIASSSNPHPSTHLTPTLPPSLPRYGTWDEAVNCRRATPAHHSRLLHSRKVRGSCGWLFTARIGSRGGRPASTAGSIPWPSRTRGTSHRARTPAARSACIMYTLYQRIYIGRLRRLRCACASRRAAHVAPLDAVNWVGDLVQRELRPGRRVRDGAQEVRERAHPRGGNEHERVRDAAAAVGGAVGAAGGVVVALVEPG